MKRIILPLFALILINAQAQYIQKIDALPYFGKVPTPPNTAKECYESIKSNDNTVNSDKIFKSIRDEVTNIIMEINKPNEAAQARAKNAQEMEGNMKKDNFENMSEQQKLEYMKTQNTGVDNSKIDFAQKMQDPAFRAQFEKMSQTEKMAYMQNSGVMKTPTVSSEPLVAKNAIITGQEMSHHNSEIMSRQIKEMRFFSDSCEASHQAIDAEMNIELKKLPTHQDKIGMDVYNDPAKAKAIKEKYWNKHLELSQKDITKYKAILARHISECKNSVTKYNEELSKIHYGNDISNETEKKSISSLASYQSSIFSLVSQLIEESDSIYKYGATWQSKYLEFQQNNK